MYIISYIHFFACIVYTMLAIAVWRKDHRSPSVIAAACSFLCFALWSFSFTFVHHPAVSYSTAAFWLNVSSIGGLLYPAFILLSISYFYPVRAIVGKAAIFLVPLYLCGVQFLNRDIVAIDPSQTVSYGWFVAFKNTVSSGIYAGYSTVSIGTIFFLLFWYWRDKRVNSVKRRQALVMLIGGALTLAGNIALDAAQPCLSISDSTLNDTIFLGWAGAIFVGLRRFRLYAPNPVTASEEILASISDGIFITDEAGVITYANPAAMNLFGDHSLIAQKRNVAELLMTEHHESFNLDPGSSSGFENTHVLFQDCHDGTRDVLLSKVPVYKDHGSIQGALYTLRDITRYQKLQQEIEHASRFESLSVFAGGVAHDLNNILGGVIGYQDLAYEELSDGTRAKGYLEKARSIFPSLRGLTRQLLTYSKGGYPTAESFDCIEPMKNAANLALSGSAVTITYETSDASLPIQFDEGQFVQIVNNIIINARQAMNDKGTITVRAASYDESGNRSRAQRDDGYVRIDIHNSGSFIEPDIQERLFEPYFTTKDTGSGLGLTTSRNILRKHGGDIRVSSDRVHGTTFSLILPWAHSDPISSEVVDDPDVSPLKGTVVILDDEAGIRELLVHMINRVGLSADATARGEETLALVSRKKQKGETYTAAILDLTVVNGQGGAEIAEELHRIDPNLPLIVSSGYTTAFSRDSAVMKQFCASLDKPYTIKDIRSLFFQLSARGKVS